VLFNKFNTEILFCQEFLASVEANIKFHIFNTNLI